ncbi:SulP family inorganic anion transporter [Pseudomonas sp. NCCP-436]|uniref:SulP family inorganic anion transporter n=1 Tax=Pseudomonas sp. NCCP-436 TaxID=2842481 RepID=UPI001C7EC6E9|nr:SulP family inorganic anion transporter [Pseudomonas sp. NCCP-436]GIZ10712.1 sodium-independent anion transporter [Pseudomonas sp. NCCP-436]
MALPEWQSLLPFLRWLPGVDRRSLRRDALAGLGGAILALPQSLAYALIAGLPAEYGLYAAVVPVMVACLWGSSRLLICGPTAAIAVVLFSSVSPLAEPGSERYIALLLLLSLLAGLFQWLLGMLRFGTLVNFVSPSVMLGFTLGAALVIAIGQGPALLGLELAGQATALSSLLVLFGHLPQAHGPSLALAGVSLLLMLLLRRVCSGALALLFGLLLGSLLCSALPADYGDAIARVAPFDGRLPPFVLPDLRLDDVLQLLPAAVACGMLGLVTSLSIARALTLRVGQPFDANQETCAQGLSNLVGPWFSAFLSAGSFTRSALNLSAGACTPLAGLFSALLVALLTLLGAGWLTYVPLPVMAAGILLICWNLVDRPAIGALWRGSRTEFTVLLLSTMATLLLELQTAIYAGVLASLFFYLKRTAQPQVRRWQDGDAEVLRIEGSIFFGACPYIQLLLQGSRATRVVLDARYVNFIDYAGVQMLRQEAQRLRTQQRCLVLRRARPQVLAELVVADPDCLLQVES